MVLVVVVVAAVVGVLGPWVSKVRGLKKKTRLGVKEHGGGQNNKVGGQRNRLRTD